MTRYRPASWRTLALPIAVCAAVPAGAQERALPGWTVSLEAGAHLPTVLYNERVQAELQQDSLLIDTRYREELRASPMARLTLRYNPLGIVGGYIGFQYAAGPTVALYEGGAASVRIEREASMFGFEFGLSMRLAEWADGRGMIGYTLGPVLHFERIDLSSGHMDAFAGSAAAAGDADLDWTERDWRSWGVALGMDARFPLSDRLALRVSGEDQVVGVNTARLEALERDEVRRLTGAATRFDFRSFTAHHPSVRIGVEYVLSRRSPPPPPPRMALPVPTRADSASAAAAAATRTAVAGDTASAIDALRSRVLEAPADASAWRGLALLLAARATSDPSMRQEAFEALQHALNVNPGDTEVLAAYGRIKTLMERRGQVAATARPLSVSDPVARADAAGVLTVAWSVANVSGPAYRLRIEVVDESGGAVALRPAGDAAAEPANAYVAERVVTGEPRLRDAIQLRLAHARPGPYSVRIVVTDPATGQTVQGGAGFEIR